MKHYLLFYEVGGDYVEKRAAFRSLHLALAARPRVTWLRRARRDVPALAVSER